MIKFWLDLPLSLRYKLHIVYNLHVLSKNCRHIKTYKNYLMFLDDEYPPTPIREELWWWQRTMNNEVIKFS
jgi:hypothetical protein